MQPNYISVQHPGAPQGVQLVNMQGGLQLQMAPQPQQQQPPPPVYVTVQQAPQMLSQTHPQMPATIINEQHHMGQMPQVRTVHIPQHGEPVTISVMGTMAPQDINVDSSALSALQGSVTSGFANAPMHHPMHMQQMNPGQNIIQASDPMRMAHVPQHPHYSMVIPQQQQQQQQQPQQPQPQQMQQQGQQQLQLQVQAQPQQQGEFAQVEAKRKKKRKGDKPEVEVDREKYKTRMCRNWMTKNSCPYYERCVFAHGDRQLRKEVVPSQTGLLLSPGMGDPNAMMMS